MTDLGDISHYLGMEVDYILEDKITLRQSTYLKKVLDRFDMTDCKPASLPMNPGVANSLQFFDGTADPKTIKWYQLAIESLMWPTVYTRLDIAYSVGVLSQYCSNSGPTHCSLVVQVLRYLFGILEFGIIFQADSSDELVGYTDSDYAGLVDCRKSTGRYIFMLSGPLSHQLKLQNTVALSSTEAEYMAACEAGKEALWISQFLSTLGFQLHTLPVDLCVDNKRAIFFTENPEFYRRTKQIEVWYQWILGKSRIKRNSVLLFTDKRHDRWQTDKTTQFTTIQEVSGDDGNELILLITFARVGVLELHGNAGNLMEMHQFSWWKHMESHGILGNIGSQWRSMFKPQWDHAGIFYKNLL